MRGQLASDSYFYAVVRFTDGKYGALEAGNDPTGWGCRDGVCWSVGDTYDEVVRWGMGDAARRALGIEQPEGERQTKDGSY